LSGHPDVPQGLICLNHLRPRWRPALRLGHPARHKGWSCRPWWPKAQRYSKPRPQYGAEFGRHGKRRQDQVGIDANRAGPCNRHKGANDDDGAKEFMMRVQEQRKEKTKNQRQLQKRGDQHDRGNRQGGVEKALRRGDNDPRVGEPAGVFAGDLHDVAPQGGLEQAQGNCQGRRRLSDRTSGHPLSGPKS
jgi:hypothetical protein